MLDKLKLLAWRLRFDRSGVTAVEYGVIAAAIVVGIVALMYTIGGELTTAFTTVKDEMINNKPAAPGGG